MKKLIRKSVETVLSKFGYQIYKAQYPGVLDPKNIKFLVDKAARLTKQEINIKTVFDVGANSGQTALMFSSLFPNAQIYSFEPIAETYQSLIKHTQNLPQVKAFQIAFGSKDESVKVYLKPNSEWNSLANNEMSDSGKWEDVRVTTIDGFLKKSNIHEIDILKTDTEGFDLEVLKGAEQFLSQNKVKFIISEVGFMPEDLQHSYFESIQTFLSSKGFRLLGFTGLMDEWSHYFVHDRLGLGYCNSIFFNTQAVMNLDR